MLYQNNIQPVWPGIYHNATLWLISVSTDWTERVTLMDKNLGATTVYNDWDTLSEANCWKYYQRWNCYGFPWSWDVNITETKQNVEWYWPWNYYSSDIFVHWTINTSWMDWINTNLWWWNTWTYEAMQWPCPEWFHVPRIDTYLDLYIKLWTLWLSTENWIDIKTYLKMPYAWYRLNNATPQKWREWAYYTCIHGTHAYDLYSWKSIDFSDTYFYVESDWMDSNWLPIRAFKNTPSVPNSAWIKLL